MSRSVAFDKMSAAGNDFIVIDNRNQSAGSALKQKAIRLCDRKLGIGADGILFLERSKKADIRMRIYNPDGSEADMCGNGVRCLSRFAVEKKLARLDHTVETGAGVIRSRVVGRVVKSLLTEPKDFREYPKLKAGSRDENVFFMNTGVPHAVIVEPALEKADVASRGRVLRYHRAFAPRGTNVNFMRLGGSNTIEVRTYERGVEGETLACGTGSTASALTAARLRNLSSPVCVKTSGGEILRIHFKRQGGRFTDVHLEGPVKKIFEGRVEI